MATKDSGARWRPNDTRSPPLTSLLQLTHDSRNARKHTPRNVTAITDALREVGAARSIVIDEDDVILAGNATVTAATEAGLGLRVVESSGDEIIAVRRRGLTAKQKTRLALFDNRAAELAEWDVDILRGLEPEDLAGMFTDEEFAELTKIERIFDKDPDDFDAEAEAAKIIEPVTKPGDLWLLGRHRLLCGDATKIDDVDRLMDGQLADLVFTDPPYNVDYTGGTKRALKISNDHMADVAFYQFLFDSMTSAFLAARPGAAIYVCHADTEGLNFRRAFVDSGWDHKQVIVWVKQHFVMGRQDYHWRHEPILYGWKPGAAHTWYGDRTQSTVWEFDRPMRSVDHPTTKPVTLIEYAIRNSSAAGALVLDLFGGSGSTLVAAEKSERRAHVCEIDPVYVDVIWRRYEDFTGEKAVLTHG
jgi:DNA modification methylase